jgi:hypothetical protein
MIAPKTRLGFLSGFDKASASLTPRCAVKALERGGRLAYHLELPAHPVKQSSANPCSHPQLDHPDAVHTERDTEIGRLIDKRTVTRKRKKRQPRAARKKQQTEQTADSTATAAAIVTTDTALPETTLPANKTSPKTAPPSDKVPPNETIDRGPRLARDVPTRRRRNRKMKAAKG